MHAIKIFLVAMCLCLSGCGDKAGMACKISGSGFTASQNCQHKCLQYRQVTCPNGETIQPQICSGKSRCQPGSCPADQACYHINDAFEEESYCMPSNVCGEMDAQTRSRWEIESKNRAAETRRKQDKKFNRKSGQATEPAAEVPQPQGKNSE